jgi:hypothetical protein
MALVVASHRQHGTGWIQHTFGIFESLSLEIRTDRFFRNRVYGLPVPIHDRKEMPNELAAKLN